MIFDSEEIIGIPIGNYTSQYFANIYLNELDHFVKETLRIKYYVRYMDDFVILTKDREEAKEIFLKISNFLNEFLSLELNKKSKYYPSALGVDFCGYKIFETHVLLRKRSKKDIRKKIKRWNKMKHLNKSVQLSWNSWLAHSSHANSYRLQQKYRSYINFDVENL